MSAQWVREICLSFPHATESVQWGDHLVFKVADKIFAITSLEPKGNVLSIKADPERFEELVDRPGVVPAPYLARAKWIALESWQAVPRNELKQLVRDSYDMVCRKLPKAVQQDPGRAGKQGGATNQTSTVKSRKAKG